MSETPKNWIKHLSENANAVAEISQAVPNILTDLEQKYDIYSAKREKLQQDIVEVILQRFISKIVRSRRDRLRHAISNAYVGMDSLSPTLAADADAFGEDFVRNLESRFPERFSGN